MEKLTLVIFGITSNLAQIKLLPALYDMAEKDLLPSNISIIGIARSTQTPAEFTKYIHQVLNKENRHHQHPIKETILKKLVKKMHYLPGHLDDPNFYVKLKGFLVKLKSQNVIYYLATYPDLYHHAFDNLQRAKMNHQRSGFVRLMIEKPIGNDLSSAKKLNQLLKKYFSEDQIYRLDHYLGKETLQNILTFRFGNGVFEPLINSEFIDHIQVTASEDFGIGDRGGYFDTVGSLKDVGQNHQLQMIAFAAMDAPIEFSNEAVTKQRLKILQELIPHPKKLILGQYEGYSQEKNVSPTSKTDTFYALKTEIDNNRFKGVPIYVRAGKKLAQTVTEISVIFKNPENRLFKNLGSVDEPNILIYRIAPNEGIVLKVAVKHPGHKIKLNPEYMQYCYPVDRNFHGLPDPYERLISDVIRGDQTFFNDAEEVEAQWSFIDQYAKSSQIPLIYKPGTWGPKEADQLIESNGRKWLEPSMQFCRI